MAEPLPIQLAGFPALRAPGEGARRPYPLVFLHGMWAKHDCLTPYLRYFSARGFDCYAASRRGRLDVPPKNAERVHMHEFLDDTLRVLDAVGRDPVVVGWSLGGILAQQVAAVGRCRAAVLLAPVAPRGIFTLPTIASIPVAIRHFFDVMRGRSLLPSFGAMQRTVLNRIPKEEHRRLYELHVPDSGVAMRELGLPGIKVDAKRVVVPLLCIAGKNDNLIPPRSVRRTARRYHAELREYQDRGHWFPDGLGWDAIAADVVDWIEAQGLGR